MTAGLAGNGVDKPENRFSPKTSNLRISLLRPKLGKPPPPMGFWGGEEQNPSGFAAGGGRNRRRQTSGFSAKRGSSDRGVSGLAGVGGDQGSDGEVILSRSGPVPSPVGGRRGGFRSGRVGPRRGRVSAWERIFPEILDFRAAIYRKIPNSTRTSNVHNFFIRTPISTIQSPTNSYRLALQLS